VAKDLRALVRNGFNTGRVVVDATNIQCSFGSMSPLARRQLTRRLFLENAALALAGGVLSGSPAFAGRKLALKAKVKDFGAAGDGSRDDTRAFVRALAAAKTVIVPKGNYALSQISIPANRNIQTAGFDTILQQIPGRAIGTPLIRITGSNVSLGGFIGKGNIQTDSGEWMNIVQISADATTGSLSNISIGDVIGKDVRGDVLYLSALPGYSLSQITSGTITGDNVYRNVVSIVGTGVEGGNIRINRVDGQRVGLFHLDIEPESRTTPATGIVIGEVYGRNVGVNGQAADAFVDMVEIGSLDLSPAYSAGSSPDYPMTQYVRPHGLLVRNTKSMTVSSLSAQGFDGQAIKYIDSDLDSMLLSIDSCTISDCAQTDDTYYAFVCGAGPRATIRISALDVVASDNINVILLCDRCSIGSITGTLAARARLLNSCPGAEVRDIQFDGSGGLAINTNSATFTGGSASSDTVAYNCDDLHFTDMTLSGSFRGGSTSQEHILENSTLNGTYYASGIYRPFA
jgi:hypothetical protein